MSHLDDVAVHNVDVAARGSARSEPIPGRANGIPPSLHSLPETYTKSGPNDGGKRF